MTHVTQVKGELLTVGETIPNLELVRIALKGFTKKWEVFVMKWELLQESEMKTMLWTFLVRRECSNCIFEGPPMFLVWV